MILKSLDGRKDNLVINITVERDEESIEMWTEESVLWKTSILAYGCESDRILSNYELSKFGGSQNAISA